MNIIKNTVESKIKDDKVMVFSKSYCGYCAKTKTLFKEYKLSSRDFEVWNIDKDQHCDKIQMYLKSVTGASTVPRVFINGTCIGGYEQTAALHRAGKLTEMLNTSTKH